LGKTAQEDVATWAPSGSSLTEDWSILDNEQKREQLKQHLSDIDRLLIKVTEWSTGMNFCKEEDTMEDTLSLMSKLEN
jgi:hypothetical protein